MTGISDVTGYSTPLTAGLAAINARDLVEMGPDGKVYTCSTTDYCSQAAPGLAFSAATVNSGNYWKPAYGQYAVTQATCVGLDGSIYTLTPNSTSSTNTGILLKRYNTLGVLQTTVNIDTSSNASFMPCLATLTNGNIAVGYIGGATASAVVAVYSSNLTQVLSPTTVQTVASSTSFMSIAALTGGNFVLGWDGTGNTLNIVIYSNTGTLVTAAAAVSGASTNSKLAALSSGNFAWVSCNSGSTAVYGVLGPTGSVVTAAAALPGSWSSAGSQGGINISTIAGYFAVSLYSTSNNMNVSVFNNAGTAQGGVYSGYTSNNNQALGNDTVNFFYLGVNAANYLFATKISSAGVASSANNLLASFIPSAVFVTIDAAGIACVVNGTSGGSGTQYAYSTINLETNQILANQVGSILPSYGCENLCMVLTGDFSVVLLSDNYVTSVSTSLTVFKYAQSAVIGVALTASAAGAGSTVSVVNKGPAGAAGAYAVNALKGTSPKQFGQGGATIPGNAGTLMGSGVVLRGLGAVVRNIN